MIKVQPHVGAMAPYALADLSQTDGQRLVSLAQNESAIPPSPLALAAARSALKSPQLYSDPNWTDLRQGLAGLHALDPAQILCGAGSMELIGALAQAFAGPGDEILSSQFGYAFFRTAARLARADYIAVPEKNFAVDPEAVLAAVTPRTRLVFVANPGNPTGTRLSRRDLVALRQRLREDILLVIDEAYGEFCEGEDPPLFDLLDGENLVILRTFSKAYGLAGLRVGWGAFPRAVAVELRKVMNPGSVSSVSLAAAQAALEDQAYMRELCTETAARRDDFADGLKALGLVVPQSRTNFQLIDFGTAEAAASADRALRVEGFVVRAMGGYGLDSCLRVTIGGRDHMDSVLRILTNWAS